MCDGHRAAGSFRNVLSVIVSRSDDDSCKLFETDKQNVIAMIDVEEG